MNSRSSYKQLALDISGSFKPAPPVEQAEYFNFELFLHSDWISVQQYDEILCELS